MVDFGGKRFDFTADYKITPGEARPLQFEVLDENNIAIPNFSGWEFEWFVRRSENDGNGVNELRRNPILRKVNGTDVTSSVPLVFLSLKESDPLRRGVFWHELWRVDADHHARLSFGDFIVIG